MNNKHVTILILLFVILVLAYRLFRLNKNKSENFQDILQQQKIRKCSESIDLLVNVVESLKAVNLPPEIAQELAMSIITENPDNEAKIHSILSDLDITDNEKTNIERIVLNNKGIVSSLEHKQAFYNSQDVFDTMDKYQNDMFFVLNK